MMKIRPNKIIIPILLLFIVNIVLFLISQGLAFAVQCKSGNPCYEWSYCHVLAEAECDDFCDEHNGCERIYLEEFWCDSFCYCWTEWSLICNDLNYDTYYCYEYDPYDCLWEQK
jgi:hypothetical protein